MAVVMRMYLSMSIVSSCDSMSATAKVRNFALRDYSARNLAGIPRPSPCVAKQDNTRKRTGGRYRDAGMVNSMVVGYTETQGCAL